ncbi:ribose transport system permease protein [Actinocorallia herbida]|uniref:Ribose transport system permease protein n=1 Tax=Actinocorallia herbida TaxID=58109 RepID=A0A3N1D0R8_9ACTN|nr:ABC transporter permease [Actinocorallia herbida]ROO87100.1 ribose transport system permease protein [Actinocorallia herbida]
MKRKLPALEDVFIPLLLVVLVVVLSTSTGSFLSSGNLLNILSSMAILAIVAFGQTFVIAGGGFDLSVGAQVALHGAVGAIVMRDTGSILLGLAAGVLSGAVFGLVNGLLVIALKVHPFMITLGTSVIGVGTTLIITHAVSIGGLPAEIAGFGVGRPLGVPWIVWVMVVCFAVATFLLSVSPFGLRVLAAGGNREAARLSGLRTERTVVATFVLAGMFAAVAGLATTARLQSAQPTVGEGLELFSVAAAVLGGSALHGGRAAMWRTLLGVLVISVIQNGLNLNGVGDAWQEVTVGIVFILAMSAELLRRFSRLRAGRATPPRKTIADAPAPVPAS